jgi:hypothetical protein
MMYLLRSPLNHPSRGLDPARVDSSKSAKLGQVTSDIRRLASDIVRFCRPPSCPRTLDPLAAARRPLGSARGGAPLRLASRPGTATAIDESCIPATPPPPLPDPHPTPAPPRGHPGDDPHPHPRRRFCDRVNRLRTAPRVRVRAARGDSIGARHRRPARGFGRHRDSAARGQRASPMDCNRSTYGSSGHHPARTAARHPACPASPTLRVSLRA